MSGRSHMAAMNGKRPSAIPARLQPEPPTQHDDLIKYIYESWNRVSKELDMCHQQHNNANYRNRASVTYYQEKEPNPQLKGQRRRQWRRRPGSSFHFRQGNVSESSTRPNNPNIDRGYNYQINYYSHSYHRYQYKKDNRSYPGGNYQYNNQRED